MAGSQDRRCALDVNILLDLAVERRFASDFLGVVREKHSPLYVSPTVFIELEFLARNGGAEQKKAANTSIMSFHKWGVTVFDIEPLKHGYTKEFAERLIRKGYLGENEYNDGLILGEAGCFGIPVLVTSDRHLLDIPQPSLIVELQASDFFPTVVASPQKILC